MNDGYFDGLIDAVIVLLSALFLVSGWRIIKELNQ